MKISHLTAVALATGLLAACGGSGDEKKAADAAPAAAPPAAAPAAGGTAAPAPGENAGVAEVNFSINNATPHTLTHLYLSPAASENWERDILGDQVAEAGQTVAINVDDGIESCMYDLRADFDDGEHIDVRGVNVCELEGRTVTVSEG